MSRAKSNIEDELSVRSVSRYEKRHGSGLSFIFIQHITLACPVTGAATRVEGTLAASLSRALATPTSIIVTQHLKIITRVGVPNKLTTGDYSYLFSFLLKTQVLEDEVSRPENVRQSRA